MPTMYDERVMTQFGTEDLTKIVYEFTTALRHERRLILEESYVAMGPEETHLRLEFISQDLLEVREARYLLVDIVEGLLEWINHDEVAQKLRPYPFTADQLEIYVDFQCFYGLYVDPNYVGWMVLEKGTSFFYAFSVKDWDKDFLDRDFWNKRIEPYAKSRSFAMAEREAESKYRVYHPLHHRQALRGLLYTPPPPGMP